MSGVKGNMRVVEAGKVDWCQISLSVLNNFSYSISRGKQRELFKEKWNRIFIRLFIG